jgi:cysteinyl-tRNA synthetase
MSLHLSATVSVIWLGKRKVRYHTASCIEISCNSFSTHDIDPKDILALCDLLRDVELADLGVLLEDRDPPLPALIKLSTPEEISAIRIQKLRLAEEKAKEKYENARKAAEKRREKLEKGRTPPSQLFRTDEYSNWNDDGFPTHDKEGQELAKSRMKKLKKEWDMQERLHNEFLAAVANGDI